MGLVGLEIQAMNLYTGISYPLFLPFPMKVLLVNILIMILVSRRKMHHAVIVKAMKLSVKDKGDF